MVNQTNTALIVVDIQNDFCEGGALEVIGGNKVAEDTAFWIDINTKASSSYYDYYAFTKDWHLPWPETNGGHFSEEPDFVDTWPRHCEQGSVGAAFHPAILKAYREISLTKKNVFYKGEGRPDYSGFQGYTTFGMSLLGALAQRGIRSVDICGLAGDYCVKQTAFDAKRYGFHTTLLTPLVASVSGEAGNEEVTRLINGDR